MVVKDAWSSHLPPNGEIPQSNRIDSRLTHLYAAVNQFLPLSYEVSISAKFIMQTINLILYIYGTESFTLYCYPGKHGVHYEKPGANWDEDDAGMSIQIFWAAADF